MKRYHVLCAVILLAVSSVPLALGHDRAHNPDRGHNPGHQEPRNVRLKVKVTAKGFEPSTVRLHAGDRLTLLVTRKTDETCAKEIVISPLGLKYELPLGKTVRIHLGAQDAGRIGFACGMDMFKGVIVVQE